MHRRLRLLQRPQFLLLVFLVSSSSSLAKYVHRYPYLYATEQDVNASFPVVEHLSPAYRGLPKDTEDRPDFLFSTTDQGYRIVEYYIHWCNTCRDFAPVFRSFAEKVRELAGLQGIEITVYAVNCSPNRLLCMDQAARDYPRIRLYKPNTLAYDEVPHHIHLHPYSVLETLGINFDRSHDEAEWDVEKEMKEAVLVADSKANGVSSFVHQLWQEVSFRWTRDQPNSFLPRSRSDLKADIHLSFDYAMRNEVFSSITAELSEEQSKVLRQWFDLLLLTLPSSWDIIPLIRELVNNFSYVSGSYDYLTAVLDEYPPPTDTWSPACSRGGQPDIGYTCGLWSLFHAVTVGTVDHNAAVFQTEQLLATEHVARSIRDYVANFFGCVICRTHFVSQYDAMMLLCGHQQDGPCRLSTTATTDPKTWVELPLWLWRTHNVVNERLLRERTSRTPTERQIQAVQWPSRRECRLCWDNDDDDDEIAVTFLRHVYGQRDAVTAALRRRLAELEDERQAKTVVNAIKNHPLVIEMKEQLTILNAWVLVVCVVSFLLGQLVSSRKKKEKID